MENCVLAVLAHPDDAEFLCAGTLARLRKEKNWSVHIASMTAGDCGSAELDCKQISDIRRQEGATAAALIDAQYHCLEEKDLNIFYQPATVQKVVALMRTVQPSIVITHAPSDYMLDHEMTSMVVRAATFNAPIKNYFSDSPSPLLPHIPHLYYCDPIEGKDLFGTTIEPGLWIDISNVIETKEQMLACHTSQREWLRQHHGMDQYLKAMRDWSGKRGQDKGVGYAEAFRQHLGHGYPSEDILSNLLGQM